MNDSFVFYKSFSDAVDELPAEQYKAIMTALTRYALKGEEPELNDPFVKALFTLMRPQIDANNRRRDSGRKGGEQSQANTKQNEASVKQNEASAKQNEASVKQNEASAKQNEASVKQNEANVNVNANANVNVNANVNANANANANTGACARKVQEKLDEYFNFLEQLDQRPLPEMKKAVIVKKLLSLSREPTEQVALIQNAILNGYKNVYPIKPRASGGSKRLTSAEAIAFLNSLPD